MIRWIRMRRRSRWHRMIALPAADLEGLRGDAERRLRAARPALDQAHGEFLDRLVTDVADRWRIEAYVAYIDRLVSLTELRREAVVEYGRLVDRVRRLDGDRARHLTIRDAAWAALCGSDAEPRDASGTAAGGVLTPAADAPTSTHRPVAAPSRRRPAVSDEGSQT